MALATWDDYPTQARFRSSGARPQNLATRLLVGAAFACAAGGMYLAFQALQLPNNAMPASSPVGRAIERTTPQVAAALPAIARDAEGFLQDSLRLTGECQTSCAQAALEIAQATRLYRLGQSSTGTRFADQSLHFFTPPATRQPAARPSAPPIPAPIQTAEIAPPAAATQVTQAQIAPAQVAPTQVRVAPTIVVPLPRPNLGADTPMRSAAPARAAADTAATASSAAPMQQASLPSVMNERPSPGPVIGAGGDTAIYDISAKTVYLPDGTRLEAHSGLGSMTDNPRFVDRRNVGPTPPGIYRLDRLPNLFFGVEALRMVPVDGKSRFGRDGFLTHTYLLRGRPGESNGCVVFPEYQRFLQAYKRGQIRRLVVVASLKGSSTQVASAD